MYLRDDRSNLQERESPRSNRMRTHCHYHLYVSKPRWNFPCTISIHDVRGRRRKGLKSIRRTAGRTLYGA